MRKELLQLAAKWKDLGEVLELRPGKTDEIGANNMFQTGACLKDVLVEWLHGNGIKPTNWETMLKCLSHDNMDRAEFAKKLKEKLIENASLIN